MIYRDRLPTASCKKGRTNRAERTGNEALLKLAPGALIQKLLISLYPPTAACYLRCNNLLFPPKKKTGHHQDVRNKATHRWSRAKDGATTTKKQQANKDLNPPPRDADGQIFVAQLHRFGPGNDDIAKRERAWNGANLGRMDENGSTNAGPIAIIRKRSTRSENAMGRRNAHETHERRVRARARKMTLRQFVPQRERGNHGRKRGGTSWRGER